MKLLAAFFFACLLVCVPAWGQVAATIPSAATAPAGMAASDRAEWFREAHFGMYIHFGLYSILGGTFDGRTLPDKNLKNGNSWYAEWAETRLEIPPADYQALVKQFNPVNFDADQWVSEAANAGMKYFVITAKHHDGFALWDSKVSTYTIAATPFKDRDILMELKKACVKHGLKFGLYYSHWQDWQAPGGAWPSWSDTKRTSDEFGVYWEAKCLPQVAELIQRYDPDMLLFDTWGDKAEKIAITPERRDELIALIRKMSPKCLINARILASNPGPNVDYQDMQDNAYPNHILATPWQTPATIERSWGWHAEDHAWKPASELLANLITNTSKGGNYILNVGPKPDGTFPTQATGRLREMGGWLAANGEAIYGSSPVFDMTAPNGVALTRKQNAAGTVTAIYAVIMAPQTGNHLDLPIPMASIAGCSILDTELPLKFEAAGNDVSIAVPDHQDVFPVVKISLKP